MLWLIWQMWIFLIIAFLIGLGVGWRLWSASGDAGKALRDAKDEIGRLQRENDSVSSVAARHQAALEASRQSSKAGSSAAPKTEKATHPSPAKTTQKAPDIGKLTDIKGLGPKAAEALAAEGISTFAEIASWTKKDIEKWDEKLTARGRIVRDDWVGQAKAKLH